MLQADITSLITQTAFYAGFLLGLILGGLLAYRFFKNSITSAHNQVKRIEKEIERETQRFEKITQHYHNIFLQLEKEKDYLKSLLSNRQKHKQSTDNKTAD